MKRMILSVLLPMFVAPCAFADTSNALKLNTVKAMYQHDAKVRAGNETLKRFAGPALKQALVRQDQYQIRMGEICGLDYDVLWQSQDPNYKAKLNYSLTPNGQVKVKIGKESVSYAVACSGNSCKITDVFSDGSVTKMINQECR